MAGDFRKVGIYHRPTFEPALAFAAELRDLLAPTVPAVWIASAWDPVASTRDLPGTDLLVCVGGDGTVLRAARAVVPHPIPILGVDMGRVAFLTEFTPDELRKNLHQVLTGHFRIEERAMIDVRLTGFSIPDAPGLAHALNDVIVGRSSVGRPVMVDVEVDGALVGGFRADAVVVATATGSTGYSLSGGGPILHPSARNLVVTPVAAHLAVSGPLVLPENATVRLSLVSDGNASLSVDGQGDYCMTPECVVEVGRSSHVARLLRFWPRPFYAHLGDRLSWFEHRRPIDPTATAPEIDPQRPA